MLLGDPYLPYVITEYKFWKLVLNEKQLPYLGRCYAWWKDREPGEGENMSFDELPNKALIELKQIAHELKSVYFALGYTVDPYGDYFRLNGPLFLANEAEHHRGHMHMHFVPRTGISFTTRFGITVVDPNWGKNYANPQGEAKLPHHTLIRIAEEMARALE